MQDVRKTPTPLSPFARLAIAHQVMSHDRSSGWNVTRALENTKHGILPSKPGSITNLIRRLR